MKNALFAHLKRISGQCDDFKNFDFKNFENFDAQKCALFFCFEEMRMTFFFRFEEILSQFHDFENKNAKNVLRMTWKERFVQFSWKAHCFSALKRIWGQLDDFHNFGAQK